MSWTFAIERASPAARRSHRSLWNYAVLLQPIWPLVIGIGIGIAQLARREDASVEHYGQRCSSVWSVKWPR